MGCYKKYILTPYKAELSNIQSCSEISWAMLRAGKLPIAEVCKQRCITLVRDVVEGITVRAGWI